MSQSSFEKKLDIVLSRHRELADMMASGSLDSSKFQEVSIEYSELDPVVAAINEFRAAKEELKGLDEMLADSDLGGEMRDLADMEKQELKDKIPTLEKNIQLALIPKDKADTKNAILEIRAGTGGQEAALFAEDLYRMYQGYASVNKWRFEVMEMSETDIGGLKEVVVNISGTNVFEKMKFESGVHRVQRVPKTETQGRIHTSAATVAVLPEAEDVDIHIEDKDLRIDVFRASGPGGQSVNTTDSAVRITHIPTGVTVSQQDEKSQHKNKAKALKILRSRLFEHERQKLADERSANRKSQVGSGDRSERIRTYNFPQGRVSDHRINLTLYNLENVLSGEALDEVINPLIAEDRAEKMAEMSW